MVSKEKERRRFFEGTRSQNLLWVERAHVATVGIGACPFSVENYGTGERGMVLNEEMPMKLEVAAKLKLKTKKCKVECREGVNAVILYKLEREGQGGVLHHAVRSVEVGVTGI